VQGTETILNGTSTAKFKTAREAMCFALYRKKIQILWKNPEILNFRHGQLI
jgi:hypothetical protein